jgi:hypothetical protein
VNQNYSIAAISANLWLVTSLCLALGDQPGILEGEILVWSKVTGGILVGHKKHDRFVLAPVLNTWGDSQARALSAQDGVFALLGFDRQGQYSVFLIDPIGSRARRVLNPPRPPKEIAHTLALAPDRQSFAVLLFNREVQPGEFTPFIDPGLGRKLEEGPPYAIFDIVLVNVATDQARVLVAGKAAWSTTLSWSPDGDHLAFDGPEGWIESLDVRRGTIRKIVQGNSPAWAPTGDRMAYRADHDILLYDMKTGQSRKVLRTYFWSSLPRGPMYWSLDGKYLAYTVHAGFLGYEERCHVLDAQSGEVFTVGTESYFCGPWLAARGN